MQKFSSQERSTQVDRAINAPRKTICQAFLDQNALVTWLPPDGMTGLVHAFEPVQGGQLKMSLIYQERGHSPEGKTSEDRDSFKGRFVELIPEEKIVWAAQFDATDPAFSGETRITWTLGETKAGTLVTAICEDIPDGVRREDNAVSSRSSLKKLARLNELGSLASNNCCSATSAKASARWRRSKLPKRTLPAL